MPKAAKAQDPPAISVATGFRETRIAGNTIDATGTDNAFNLCLAGNHFGTTVTDNVLTVAAKASGSRPFRPNRRTSGAGRMPHAGLTIQGNKIRQAALPARIATDQGPTNKTSAGRS